MVANTWKTLACYGFVPANYGTHRWLERNPTAERLLLATFDLGDSRECRVEMLPAASRVRYEHFGLVFSERINSETNIAAFQSALSIIASVPTLYAIVATYLRTLHVLQAPNLDYDVSYSDPDLPFSIFVSVPAIKEGGKLRLAESIVHECMHLQLSIIETLLPLVSDRNAAAFSPWRRSTRPLASVLHGLYVFTVIHEFFAALDRIDILPTDDRLLATKRQNEIAYEVAQVSNFAVAEGLTDEGRVLAYQLLAYLSN